MIRAVVWKELREQGLIAVMLAVLGGALLVAAAVFADPPMPNAPMTDIVAALGAGRLLTLMLVVTAGMVCGGALFAAEKESGTIAFLEALPTGHWALWRAKVVAGLLLALAEVLALMAVAAALGLADVSFLARLLVYALLAFAWGTLGSTLARTTLGSVGIAIPAATLASFAFLFPIVLLFARPGAGGPPPTGWALFELLMVGTPLAISAWRFTAPDRARSAEIVGAGPWTRGPSVRPRKPGTGARALAWLTAQQLRTPGTVLSLFALAFGLALLLPNMRPLVLWPVLALAAGVLAGVTAFGDEQAHQTARFWSEHRLPVGRAWWVKIGIHFGFLLWLLVLLALPSVLRAQVETTEGFGRGRSSFAGVFQSRLFDELGAQTLKFLLVPAVYGFAFGHVCGLLFRKLVVATGVATMLAGTCAAVWEMSLLAGGVTHWQVWLPAGAVLLTGRVLIRGWAADRATARGPLTRLCVATGVLVVSLVGGVAYRVLQVPDDPTGADDAAFVARLPNYDENVGGRDFRTAADRFARLAAASVPEPSRVPDARRRPRVDERLDTAARFGWPTDDPELAEYLDRVFDDPPTAPGDKPWPNMAADAARLPLGVYELPQLVGTTATTATALDNARRMPSRSWSAVSRNRRTTRTRYPRRSTLSPR
ncbi:hypothetical protein [Frigoriglobus tundricola]|uniref:Uncharacterized protein n=1 Tax=Frigoriglobus tundricola TaxID=2774151 RepID=A0A6M5Z150_9BACT|nr:hypothetical protein [Frigoriglobus tundricola]QJW99524.1 hypothetical protein FTUN_7136 [Frigoriglobus tundricola]